MPDLIAIIAKGAFEEEVRKRGKALGPGEVLPIDRYVSKNKALAPLAQGGRLVLVTVRPPNERLWLAAILDSPVFASDMWRTAGPNTTPITDITPLRKTMRLASGKGLSQAKGALGMSLQTPRALAPEDMEAILAAIAGPGDALAKMAAALPASVSAATRELVAQLVKAPDDEPLRERAARRLAKEGAPKDAKAILATFKHLNEHERKNDQKPGDLPCLCKKCIDGAPAEIEVLGLAFGRDFVCKMGRILHFWAPREVLADATDTQNSVRMALQRRIKALDKARKQRARMRSR